MEQGYKILWHDWRGCGNGNKRLYHMGINLYAGFPKARHRGLHFSPKLRDALYLVPDSRLLVSPVVIVQVNAYGLIDKQVEKIQPVGLNRKIEVINCSTNILQIVRVLNYNEVFDIILSETRDKEELLNIKKHYWFREVAKNGERNSGQATDSR